MISSTLSFVLPFRGCGVATNTGISFAGAHGNVGCSASSPALIRSSCFHCGRRVCTLCTSCDHRFSRHFSVRLNLHVRRAHAANVSRTGSARSGRSCAHLFPAICLLCSPASKRTLGFDFSGHVSHPSRGVIGPFPFCRGGCACTYNHRSLGPDCACGTRLKCALGGGFGISTCCSCSSSIFFRIISLSTRAGIASFL